MKLSRLIIVLVAAALVTTVAARESRADSYEAQRLIGTLLGAGLGGLAGSAIGKGTGNKVAIGAGTFVGAVLGSRMSADGLGGRHAGTAYVPAKRLDFDDGYDEYRPRKHYRHGHRHFDHGQFKHRHKHRRVRYVVRERYVVVPPAYTPPIPYGSPPEAGYCREYRTDGRIGGVQQPLYGRACLQPDGSWQIVE